MSVDDSDKETPQTEATGKDMRATPHTFKAFDEELEQLRGEVLVMAGLVTKSTETAVRGLLEGNVDLCNEVIADDEAIDQLEKDIDQIGMHIMLRHKPIATDLRRVLSSMNMSRMLERIGDHAVNIAKKSRKMLKTGQIEESKMLEPLYTLAIAELRDAVTAYADDNEELALSLEARDKELDRLHKRLTKSLSALVEERQEGAVQLIQLLFVTRSLERIGDLAVNLGEEVVFIESAQDIRHAHP